MNGIEAYRLKRYPGKKKDIIEWYAPELQNSDPDHFTLSVKIADMNPGQWYTATPQNTGITKIALIKQPGNQYFGSADDAVLVVSLKDACSRAAVLFHEGDDQADRIYYYATDSGNQTHDKVPNWPEDQWAFILRASGQSDCPIDHYRDFLIGCLKY